MLVNLVEKNKIGNSNSKNIRKSRNKIVKILANSKVQNLFMSKNLPKI